jgi:hypothetical protein
MRCCSGSCYIPEGLYHEPGAFVVLDISADLADDLWGSVAICRGTVVTNRKEEKVINISACQQGVSRDI